MAQAVLKDDFILPETEVDTIELVKSIKDFIYKNDCPKLSMDISKLNIMEASKVTIICSTYHWAKYPNGEISWKTSSPEINELIKPLNLGNIRFISDQKKC